MKGGVKMQNITITFSSSELTAIRTAVDNELACLQDDLENNRVSKSEISAARKSVELCNSVIDKIDVSLPNSTYEPCARKS